MKPFLNLKSVDETQRLLFNFKPAGSETAPLEAAAGRRLAEAFHAPHDLPAFARSGMDGFAVRARDVFGASETSPALLEVIGNCPVGAMPSFSIGEGEAATILTGAPLPKGADAVIMVENTREAGPDHIEIARSAAPGENVIEKDEDARSGEELIPRGRLLRPQEIGILAAFGVQEARVFPRPKIAIISTGDEVIPIGSAPRPGQVRDVNSHSLAAFCKARGAEPLLLGIVRDDPKELSAMLNEARALADAVLVSGGSSAGMRDHTVDAFLSLPGSRLMAHGVAIRPGKPFILAESGGKAMIGLPGHVTSALICAHVFIEPLLASLQGLDHQEPKAGLPALLDRSIASAQGRRDYIRCRLTEKDGRLTASPVRAPSAVLSSMLAADGCVICPENSEGLRKGQEVMFYPF